MAVILPAPAESRKETTRNGLFASRRLGRWGRWLLVLAMTVWFLAPLLPLALWFFAERWSFPGILPQEWGTGAVQEALAQGAVPAFGRSFGVALAVMAVATPMGLLAARAFAFHRPPGAGFLSALVFAPLALPPFAAAFGLNVLFLRLHLPPMFGIVLVLAVYALPYTTFTLRVAYGAYELGFEDEARMLGASRWRVLSRVHLPLVAPALMRAAFLAFLVGWSDYVVTLLVGGGTLVTVPLLVASAAAGTGNDAMLSVLSVTAVLPPLVLLLGAAIHTRRRLGVRS